MNPEIERLFQNGNYKQVIMKIGEEKSDNLDNYKPVINDILNVEDLSVQKEALMEMAKLNPKTLSYFQGEIYEKRISKDFEVQRIAIETLEKLPVSILIKFANQDPGFTKKINMCKDPGVRMAAMKIIKKIIIENADPIVLDRYLPLICSNLREDIDQDVSVEAFNTLLILSSLSPEALAKQIPVIFNSKLTKYINIDMKLKMLKLLNEIEANLLKSYIKDIIQLVDHENDEVKRLTLNIISKIGVELYRNDPMVNQVINDRLKEITYTELEGGSRKSSKSRKSIKGTTMKKSIKKKI